MGRIADAVVVCGPARRGHRALQGSALASGPSAEVAQLFFELPQQGPLLLTVVRLRKRADVDEEFDLRQQLLAGAEVEGAIERDIRDRP